jgi:preprotein translocase subunit SecB
MKVKNVQIQVNKTHFQHNHLEGKTYKLNPKMRKQTGHVKDNIYHTTLSLVINGSEEQNFPFDIEVEIRGLFTLEDTTEIDEVTRFLETQGITIVYPYLRTTVTSITNTAMVSPVVLPVVNPLQLFRTPDQSTS